MRGTSRLLVSVPLILALCAASSCNRRRSGLVQIQSQSAAGDLAAPPTLVSSGTGNAEGYQGGNELTLGAQYLEIIPDYLCEKAGVPIESYARAITRTSSTGFYRYTL